MIQACLRTGVATRFIRITCIVLALLVSALVFNQAAGMDGHQPPAIRRTLDLKAHFQSIRIEGNISVMLTNEPAGTVVLEGSQKSLQKARHKLENNVLVISTPGDIFGCSKLTVYLSALTLQELQLNGDSHITSIECLQSDTLHLSLNGNIDVRVKTIGKLSFETPADIELHWKRRASAIKTPEHILEQVKTQ